LAAHGFMLFAHGGFFAFERLARLLAAPAFRLETPAVRSGSRGGACALTQGVLIATLRFVAPARGGAFAEEGRIMVGDEGGRSADAKRSSRPAGQRGSGACQGWRSRER
jgi:hypothetical protein